MDKLREIVGFKYKQIYLKKMQVRIRNRIKPSNKRQPTVSLIASEDKRKFKLLHVKDSNNIHLNQIIENQRWFGQVDFVPKILWNDDNNVLIEYIEGNFPDIETKEFAKAYAKNLVQVHDLDSKLVPFEKFNGDIKDNLELFVANNFIGQHVADKVSIHLELLAPDEVRTSMVYADQNRTNFVSDKKNRLYFIDLGSFQRKRATDEFIFGGVLFESVDQKAFRETYLAEGGEKFMFENTEFLTMANLIRNGAGHLRRYLEVPFFDWRLKNARLRNVRRAVNKLIAFVS